mmetsp:Transcript_102828/g.294829  ORF Transcript_102828/g.294829 Transcript_102828/m.294829 type:complete len:223 (+) Transcript_102828:681-1349(+)
MALSRSTSALTRVCASSSTVLSAERSLNGTSFGRVSGPNLLARVISASRIFSSWVTVFFSSSPSSPRNSGCADSIGRITLPSLNSTSARRPSATIRFCSALTASFSSRPNGPGLAALIGRIASPPDAMISSARFVSASTTSDAKLSSFFAPSVSCFSPNSDRSPTEEASVTFLRHSASLRLRDASALRIGRRGLAPDSPSPASARREVAVAVDRPTTRLTGW